MQKADLIERLKQEVRGLDDVLVAIDYENAIDDATNETTWAFPVTDGFEILWLKNRAKRHLYTYLRDENAHKFKFEQINLQNRFEHYSALIKTLDREFKEAIEENPAKFAGVDVYKIFGTYVHAGFSTNEVGEETTYDTDNAVTFYPNDNS